MFSLNYDITVLCGLYMYGNTAMLYPYMEKQPLYLAIQRMLLLSNEYVLYIITLHVIEYYSPETHTK